MANFTDDNSTLKNLSAAQQKQIESFNYTPTQAFVKPDYYDGMFTGAGYNKAKGAQLDQLRNQYDANQEIERNKQYAAQAKAIGDKDLFNAVGGKVDPLDPWGFYREGAGDQLANSFLKEEDPSNFYRSKLQQMSTGDFGPDDPSYQWRFDQGQKASERSLASRGLLNSGNAALELQQYGQGAASQEYQAQFMRTMQGMSSVEDQYNTQYSRLAQMAGVGLDPSATDKIASANFGTMAGVMNTNTNANASMTNNMVNAQQRQGEWNDQLGMAREYDAGVGEGMQRPEPLQQQARGGYSGYSQQIQQQPINNGTSFGDGGGSGFVVRTS